MSLMPGFGCLSPGIVCLGDKDLLGGNYSGVRLFKPIFLLVANSPMFGVFGLFVFFELTLEDPLTFRVFLS